MVNISNAHANTCDVPLAIHSTRHQILIARALRNDPMVHYCKSHVVYFTQDSGLVMHVQIVPVPRTASEFTCQRWRNTRRKHVLVYPLYIGRRRVRAVWKNNYSRSSARAEGVVTFSSALLYSLVIIFKTKITKEITAHNNLPQSKLGNMLCSRPL